MTDTTNSDSTESATCQDSSRLIPTLAPGSSAASLLGFGIDSLLQATSLLPIGPCEATSKLVDVYNRVKAGLLQRKIFLFLTEAESAPSYISQERKEWASAENQEELGRQIILMLERADDERKSTIYGQLYCALMRRDLNKDQFGRLCSCVDRAFFDDLRHLSEFKEATLATNDLQPIAESLQTAGLLSLAGIDGGGAGDEAPGGNLYQLNLFGLLLLKSMEPRQAQKSQAT